MSAGAASGSTAVDRSLCDLLSLEGRTAVVTGGAQGIGRAVVRRLAESGASVFIADIDGDLAGRAAVEVAEEYGVHCEGVATDVSDSGSVFALASRAAAHADRLDVWVNCAAVWSTTAVTETSDETWRRILAVDLDGSFYCSREAARQMTFRGKPGVIVLYSSLSAHKGRMGRTHYGAAKHGVNGLVKNLAVELGPQGIRVLAIAPSVTDTAAARSGARDQESGGDAQDRHADIHEQMMARALEGMPLGRMADPDELARATVFAVSDLAEFMTGCTLHVDGGASAT